MFRTSPTTGHRRRLRTVLLGAAVASALALTAPGLVGEARATPREDMRASYDKGLAQFNELEIDAAIGTIEGAIAKAEAEGAGQDPTVASLYLMKAALIYSNEGDAGADRIKAALGTAVKLNYYVVVPAEFRSEGLTKYLNDARASVGTRPDKAIAHDAPAPACGGDIVFEALLGVPDGGLAALYWRKVGETGDPAAEEMFVFSNVADFVLKAERHGDADIEYFIYAFDSNNQPVANLGTQEDPMVLMQGCAPEAPEVTPEPEVVPEPEPSKETALPRAWINLGVGTGFGVASGAADLTYEQYFPRNPNFAYGPAQAGCAIARWVGGSGGLPSTTELYGGVPGTVAPGSYFDIYGGANAAAMSMNYDPSSCANRHPVQTGMAPALFHVEPEVQVRVAKRVTVGVFTRLQVVTGSKVIRDDPTYPLDSLGDPNTPQAGTAYWDDVYTAAPQSNYQDKPPFSWAVGAKLRYYFLDDMAKFRLFAGGFAGYGQARLRVDMGFANDRTGNSVPDNLEVGFDQDQVGNCFAVWPYNAGCENGATGDAERNLAIALSQTADSANRVDTVSIGPGFIGGLFGFNYQIVKNFGFFGEIQVGGWFPAQGSLLFDLNVGPAITF